MRQAGQCGRRAYGTGNGWRGGDPVVGGYPRIHGKGVDHASVCHRSLDRGACPRSFKRAARSSRPSWRRRPAWQTVLPRRNPPRRRRRRRRGVVTPQTEKPATPKKGKLTPEQKAAEAAAEEARWGAKEIEAADAESRLEAAPKPKATAQPQPAPTPLAAPPAAPAAVPLAAPSPAPATASRAASVSGKRVAAFWIITPVK